MQLADYTIKTMLIGPGAKTPSNRHNLVHGYGLTMQEALDDLIDSLDIDFDEEELRSGIDVNDDPAYIALGVKDNEHEPALWCLSMHYYTVEDRRLERLEKLVTPYCYSSSQPTGNMVWGTITVADGSIDHNDLKITEWPLNYYAFLSGDKFKSNELYFYMPYCAFSDHSGDTITAANNKYMVDNYSEDWLHPVYGYDYEGIAIGVTGLLASEQFEEIFEIIQELEDYPIIDEITWSEFEIDAAGEAWESWAGYVFERLLEEEFGKREWPNLWEFFEKWREKAGCEWYCEVGPDVTINLEAIVEEIAKGSALEWRI